MVCVTTYIHFTALSCVPTSIDLSFAHCMHESILCSSPSLSWIAVWRAFIASCRGETSLLRSWRFSATSLSFGNAVLQCGHTEEFSSHCRWHSRCVNFLQHGNRKTFPLMHKWAPIHNQFSYVKYICLEWDINNRIKIPYQCNSQ